MEIPFDPALYQQTRPADPGEEDLTPRLPSLAHDLAEATKALIRRPYDPTGWFARAKLLDELRFPELATGDAYKASLLCRKHLQVETIFDGGEGGSAGAESMRWRLGEAMGFWMLDEDVGSHPGDDEASVCELNDAKGDDLEHRLRELSNEVGLFLSEHIRDFPESEEGSYRPRMYPWMPERLRTRTQALLDQVNEEFVQQGTVEGRAACVVKCGAFGGDAEVWGVFAGRDLLGMQMIVVDDTTAFGCIGPEARGEKYTPNGGLGCGDPIHPNLEDEGVEQDLCWIRRRAGQDAPEVILNCRLLLAAIQEGVEHPLDHPKIARLTPNYGRERAVLFGLECDFRIMIHFLVQFGIDVFANRNFDHWVLFSLQPRVDNNSWSDPLHSCISPLLSLFNHSCSPNVEWRSVSASTTLQMYTLRPVAAGEQLFVEYDGYASANLKERRRRMRKWLNGDCQCERCLREEFALGLGKKMLGEIHEGKEEDGEVEVDEGVAVGGWNGWVKPVFPEDGAVTK